MVCKSFHLADAEGFVASRQCQPSDNVATAISRKGQLEWTWREMLVAAGKSDEAAATLAGYVLTGQPRSEWRGASLIPPGSLLEVVTSSFERGSNLPLEIPWVLTLQSVAAELLARNIQVRSPRFGVRHPMLWHIVLADSCSGKTYCADNIARIGDIQWIQGFDGIRSAAGWFDLLLEQPVGVALRDEFGQFISQVETDERMAACKDLLLRLYDAKELTWRTKRDGTRAVTPKWGIVGMTQRATWHQKISAESMLDGTAQRFLYVIADRDPSRPWQNYPAWTLDNQDHWKCAWSALCRPLQPGRIYETTPQAEEYFNQQFYALAASGNLPESFARRVFFSALSYALIYHVLRADSSPQIGVEDYGYAFRVVRLHLSDTARVLGDISQSPLARIIARGQELFDECRREGRQLTAGMLARRMNAIRTVSEAQGLVRILKEIHQHTP